MTVKPAININVKNVGKVHWSKAEVIILDKLPEYRKYRCCMCSQIEKNLIICSKIDTVLHPKATSCRFVKSYEDERGWQYFVRSGIGSENFKIFYLKPGKNGGHGYRGTPWRDSFDEAQSDLNTVAEKKHWIEK